MACYRDGGCGPYEHLSCSECQASRPEYLTKPAEKSVPKEEENPRMVKKFYISDWHYNHKNCLAFDNRPFTSIEQMNETLVEPLEQRGQAGRCRIYAR